MKPTWAHLHLPRLTAGDPDVISVKIPGQQIAYTNWISFNRATFTVSESGRRRCLATGQRNVHAWVVGQEVCRVDAYPVQKRPGGYRTALYDPFKGGSFVDSETLLPLTHADGVIMSGKHVWYYVEGE